MFSSKTDDKGRAHTGSGAPAPRTPTAVTGAPSIISADLKVTGNLESAGDLQIDGQVEGDIKTRSVTVGEQAKVKGSIEAESARICGELEGQVRAGSVTLAGTAKVHGDITHQTLTVEAGAYIEGQVRNADRAAQPRKSDAGQAAEAKPAASA